MKGIGIIVNIILIQLSLETSVSPNWIVNPNIDTGSIVNDIGEVVAANMDFPVSYLPSGYTATLNQHFNRTTFPSVPRVILSMIGYVQQVPASPSTVFGFQIKITNINRTNFNYTATSYGVTTINLRYLYMAIVGETTTYYTDVIYKTCK